ncbi:HAMP domain-containing histidine kinase [Novosphingobium sp. G106]|uniref:sensor histidine kinase n=1 Tax=Novosphingobium sp. G106 TaxID=2849500 RepID=UPI001C2D8C01|nr:HAMP domain-containing sensor histidine kinase [Novosphingobium sp. G106]MBV1687942.1 HAMP domain-containing histidine kinase [Novosphingobium sp. G106]
MHNLWRSAAYRIAFGYAAAFAFAILLLGTAIFFVADAEFRQQRDGVLSEEMEDLANEGLGRRLIHELEERGRLRTRQDFAYALFDRAGRRIGGSLDIPRPPIGYSLVQFRDLAGEWEEGRAKAMALSDGSRLVVALDLEAVDAIDRTILAVFAVTFIAILVIGVGAALMLGRYLRTRLGSISRTARAIVAGEGERRIAVGKHGDEFDEVSLALNAMLDRIDGLMENLRQVSSDVAHDLRKPLLRLRNQLDLVGNVEGAEQRAIELLDEILRLFTAILRIAEVEGGGLENYMVRVDLSTDVDNITSGYASAFADSGHFFDWTIAPDIAVWGDRGILVQSVANLLDNARIHTPRGTSVRLELMGEDGTACLTISDNGPGVSPSERPQLLRRFFRAEASRTTPGNGLGLTLVAAAASAHGGTIAVEDTGPGLRIAVTLPRLVP